MKDLFCCFFPKNKSHKYQKLDSGLEMITDGSSLKPPSRSTGYVIFTRKIDSDNYYRWMILTKNILLYVPNGPHFNIIIDKKSVYYKNGVILIPPKVESFKCKIISTDFGEWGNTKENTITASGGPTFGVYYNWDSVTNPEPTAGGYDGDLYGHMATIKKR